MTRQSEHVTGHIRQRDRQSSERQRRLQKCPNFRRGGDTAPYLRRCQWPCSTAAPCPPPAQCLTLSMDLAANFASIHQRIQAACDRAGRDPASVLLVAVSKGQSPEKIRAAAAAGQILFGESRV